MSANKPRIPAAIPLEHLDPHDEGRTYSLLSQRAFNYLKRFQLQYLFAHHHQPFTGLLKKKHHPELEHNVLIGAHHEAVVMDKSARLGDGTFGKVVVGARCDTDEFVAIKKIVISPKNKTMLEDGLNEIQNLKALNRFTDEYLQKENFQKLYIVQTLAYGQDYLKTLFNFDGTKPKKNPIPLEQKLLMAKKAAQAVQALHQQGLLHGDLKPNNMVWDPLTQSCTLLDFATTRAMNAFGQAQGKLTGTELFMAPELLTCTQNLVTYDARTEIYSLAHCLCMIFSSYNFAGNIRKLTLSHAQGDHPKGVNPLLIEGYCDLLKGPTNSRMQRQLKHLFKQMLDSDPLMRPSLDKIIATLGRLLDKYERPETAKVKEPKPAKPPVLFSQQKHKPASEPKLLSLKVCKPSL